MEGLRNLQVCTVSVSSSASELHSALTRNTKHATTVGMREVAKYC